MSLGRSLSGNLSLVEELISVVGDSKGQLEKQGTRNGMRTGLEREMGTH